MTFAMELLDNALRGTLILLSALSFIPQYRKIIRYGPDCVAISPYYVVLNLIGATEQLALGLYAMLEQVSNAEVSTNSLPTTAEYLNLAQVAVVFICHLILFGLFLYYPPGRTGAKSIVIALFNVFILISLIPVIFAVFLSPSAADHDPYHDRRWLSSIFWGIHGFYLHPMVTVLGSVGLVDQVMEMYTQRSRLPGALSAASLASQSVVFLLVGLSAIVRVPLPWQTPFVSWYQIGNLAFSVIQAVLFWIVVRWRAGEVVKDCERQPLLERKRTVSLIDSRGRRVY